MRNKKKLSRHTLLSDLWATLYLSMTLLLMKKIYNMNMIQLQNMDYKI